MTGESSKTEGTFGSFLEMLNAQKPLDSTGQPDSPNQLEDNIVHLLTLLTLENGVPILVDDLYAKSGIRLKPFGEAVNTMLREGLIVLQDGDKCVLAPDIREQL